MNKFHSLGLFVFAMLAGVFMFHCATVRAVGPKVIHLAAEDCVELASGDVKAICATVDELVPLLDLIAARRIQASKKSVFDGGMD